MKRAAILIVLAALLCVASSAHAEEDSYQTLSSSPGRGSGAGKSGWTPAAIVGVVQWLNPASGITIATGVSQWVDSAGGHTLAQGTGASQPGLSSTGAPNSWPDLTFNGTSSYIFNASAPTTSTAYTVFLVHKFNSITAGGYSFSIGDNSHGGSFGCISTSKRWLSWSGVADVSDNTANATTSWEKWTITNSGTAQTLRVNGAAHTLASQQTPAAPNQTTAGGRNQGSLNNLFTGSLAEVIVVNRVLDTGEIFRVESYEQSKYSL